MNELEAILTPIRSQAQYDALVKAAGADKHQVIGATHVMTRGEEIVGYLSLAGMPMVHAWFSLQVKNPRHSREMIRHGETVLRERNVKTFTVAVSPDSPFSPNMERLGYKKLGITEIWVRNL